MIVCHCKALTDRDVRDAVGCGALSRRAVARACGAGAECGGCRPVIDEIIAQARSAVVIEHARTLTLIEIHEPAAACS